jgi:hypothetical protein
MGKFQKLVLLGALTTSLAGCAWHNSGPCYGIGCPTWATAAPQKSSSNVAQPPKKDQTATNAAPATRLPDGQIAQAAKPKPTRPTQAEISAGQ